MKIIGDKIVEHEGISIKHKCYFCDNVIYNENPDEKGWYQNWLWDWVCEACFEAQYHTCEKCDTIIEIYHELCVDCQAN